jgi:hypothetical protein
MAFGLQIWDESGNLMFDSTLAVGGVSLGTFAVLLAGQTFTFPTMIGRTGFLMPAGGAGINGYTSDNSLGYLRFVFPPADYTRVVSLFAR